MSEAVQEAYSDLFQVNKSAHKLSKPEVINKFKTLSQGQFSESVLDKMAMTFTALVGQSDFEHQRPKTEIPQNSEINVSNEEPQHERENSDSDSLGSLKFGGNSLGGLHYNIQIILPESRDPKVYDALFRSLREHLF